VATAQERAVSFLYSELDRMATFRDDHRGEAWPEQQGRVTGALGALSAVGLLGADQAEAWRPRLLGADVERPAPSDGTRQAAEELLGDSLEAVPEDDDGTGEASIRFEGALDALQAVGAASGEWYERRSRRMGWPTADEVSEWHPSGTQKDLRAVLAGPADAVDGVRVICALCFGDGVSVVLRLEDGADRLARDPFDFELVDDVGTSYSRGGGGAGGRDARITYDTPIPAGATWLELRRGESRSIRIPL
jgi:hypothetical protein